MRYAKKIFFFNYYIILNFSWATPAQQLKVQRFKPKGTVVDAEYNLNIYERNVQVSKFSPKI